MDDFLIFTRSRWHLRRAVRELNLLLSRFGFEQHPDKTFIGRLSKGSDWMGVSFNTAGCTAVAPRAINNMLQKLRRLYEQTRHLTAQQRQVRVVRYLQYWLRWARGSDASKDSTEHTLHRQSKLSNDITYFLRVIFDS